MPLPEHNLEREFAIFTLTLYLQRHPDKAAVLVRVSWQLKKLRGRTAILAVNHYEDYMNLADDYKRLRVDFEKLQQENIRLKLGSCSQRSISLPSLINQYLGAS